MPETGTVARWINNKGVGFITPDKGGDDVLVHHSEVQMKPEEGEEKTFVYIAKGEKVQYELAPDPKGEDGKGKMIATKVTGPDGAPIQGKTKEERLKEKKERQEANKEKKKEEAKKKADKDKKKGKGKGKEKVEEEKRIDPEDKKAYTWEEIFAHYKGTYKKKALLDYWDTMKPVKKKKGKGKGSEKKEEPKKEKKPRKPRKGADEKRKDPEDGAELTWEEMFRKYKETTVKEKGRAALVEIWKGAEVVPKAEAA